MATSGDLNLAIDRRIAVKRAPSRASGSNPSDTPATPGTVRTRPMQLSLLTTF